MIGMETSKAAIGCLLCKSNIEKMIKLNNTDHPIAQPW
jgi:hypothetical protein